MKWPWEKARDSPTVVQHQKEIEDVKGRLDLVEDVLAEELAVLQRNGQDDS